MKKDKKNVFYFLKLIERIAARFQGKGYGSATIKNEIKSIASLLKSAPLCALDIGGNIGDYTAELCTRWPDITIHVFEPSPTNLPKLRIRYSDQKNILIHPFAVSDFEGSATLFADQPGSGMGSLSHRDVGHLQVSTFDSEENVKVVSMEKYWENLGGGVIDIVKLDIEGHELSALKGMGKLVEKIKIFQFEFGGCNIDTRTFFKDFFYFFTDKGFRIYRITPLGAQLIPYYKETDEFFSTTNYIALNGNM